MLRAEPILTSKRDKYTMLTWEKISALNNQAREVSFFAPLLCLKYLAILCFGHYLYRQQSAEESTILSLAFPHVTSVAILSQVKLMDTKRLYDKIGRMKKVDFDMMKIKFVSIVQDGQAVPEP